MPTLAEEMLSCLKIRQVKDLYSHEQVIAYNLKRLKESMLNIGHLVDPLVVDEKTGVVLDGNHRLKVLEIIECPYAACQVVDYQSDEIGVTTWYPVADIPPEKMLKLDSIKHEKVDIEEGRKAVDDLRSPFMVRHGQEAYLLNPGSYKMKEMIEEQKYILSLFNGSLEYIPGEDIETQLKDGRSVLYRRSYTKEEIIKTAQGHNPLPPKSTRHLIPGRIIRLNMKLGWLNSSPEEATKALENMLKVRAYTGNVRKYFEPVIVIY